MARIRSSIARTRTAGVYRGEPVAPQVPGPTGLTGHRARGRSNPIVSALHRHAVPAPNTRRARRPLLPPRPNPFRRSDAVPPPGVASAFSRPRRPLPSPAMTRPVVSLLTDFGVRDVSASICRAVVLGICPDAEVIDLTHEVRKYSIRDGALALWCALPYLPIGFHVAVVDPGVGTARRPLAILTGRGDVLIGPDNGLLDPGGRAPRRRRRVARAPEPGLPPAGRHQHVPRPRRVRAGRRAPRAAAPRSSRWAGSIDRPRSSRRRCPAARGRRRRRSRPRSCTRTRSAT